MLAFARQTQFAGGIEPEQVECQEVGRIVMRCMRQNMRRITMHPTDLHGGF